MKRYRCPACGIVEDALPMIDRLFKPPLCAGASFPFFPNDRDYKRSPHTEVEMEPCE